MRPTTGDGLIQNKLLPGKSRENSTQASYRKQKNRSKRKTWIAMLMSCWLAGVLPSTGQAQTYQWKNVQMRGGGFVTGIIYSTAQQNLIYARTDIGGAYRWDATNKVWIPLSDGIANGDDFGVVSLAADPSDANRVYMATGLYTQSWGGTGAIYSSTDKGATWTRNSLSIKLGGNEDGRSAGERLQVDPNLGSILFLGSSTDGLWKSTNNGAAWSKVSSFPVSTSPIGSGGISFVLFDKSSSSVGTATKTIYVGVLQTGTNLYKSTDGGATWTAVSGQPTNLMPHQAARASNGIIYISYSDNNGPNNVSAGAVLKLNPGNNSWTNISPPAGQGGYGGISVDAQNANHVIVSTLDRWSPRDEVFRSTDGGTSWTALLANATWDHSLAPYAAGVNPHWLGDVDMDPFNSNNAWFVTGYGAYNSNNLTASQTNWIFQTNGLEETAAIELISPPSGAPLLSAIGDFDGFKHDNLDVSPAAGRSTQYGTNSSLDFAQNLPTFMARTYNNASGNYGSYSTDGGSTWTAFTSVPSGTSNGGKICVSADGNRIVWAPAGAAAMYYSTNRGSSWTACSGVPAGLKPVSDRVNSLKFYVYDAQNGNVWVSTNGGASFSVQTSGLPTVFDYQVWLTGIRTVYGVEGDIWLYNPNGVYHSTNSGTSFTQVSSVQNAKAVSFGKAAAGKTYPAVYIVGNVNSTYGFYRSDDGGTTWTRFNDAQHQYGTVNVITGDPRVYGRLYFGGNGRGIIYADLQTSSSIVSGGTYRVIARHSNQLMDVVGASTADGAQVDQWPNNGGSTNQQWVITSVGGGYYTFKAVHSGKNLDINGFSSADGAKVQQWTAGTGTNQQFQLVDMGGGYFQIKARHSGKCLDVASASTSNGALIQQWTCGNQTNQQFRFELVSAARLTTEQPVVMSEVETVAVFPNPSSRYFQINAPSDFSYEIYDLTGRKTESGRGKDGSRVGSTLKPGLYLIKVQMGTINKVIKVSKQ
jgi:hypothetical protein